MSGHDRMNMLFAGVGGQGILLVAELAARSAIRAGYDVKKTEVHGAAQRGGSVVSHVRFARKVYSPLIPAGEVDILLALEKLEGVRWAHTVRQGGLIVLNDEERTPMPLDAKPVEYPRAVDAFLRGKGYRVHLLDATALAAGLGNYRAANMILLGMVAAETGIDEAHWTAILEESLSPTILDLNLKAFRKGRDTLAEPVCPST